MPTKFKDKDGKEIHQNSNIALPHGNYHLT
jgi:hypothetical protein